MSASERKTGYIFHDITDLKGDSVAELFDNLTNLINKAISGNEKASRKSSSINSLELSATCNEYYTIELAIQYEYSHDKDDMATETQRRAELIAGARRDIAKRLESFPELSKEFIQKND